MPVSRAVLQILTELSYVKLLSIGTDWKYDTVQDLMTSLVYQELVFSILQHI